VIQSIAASPVASSITMVGRSVSSSITMIRSIVCLFLLCCCSSEENLSSRTYQYSSNICLRSSTNFSAESVSMFDISSCYLSCTFSSTVTINTNINKEERTKRFIFTLETPQTSCEEAFNKDEYEDTFSVKILTGNDPVKQIKSKNEIVKGIQNGIIDTFLASANVHEGKVPEESNCKVTSFEEEELRGYDRTCIYQKKTKELVRSKVMLQEVLQVHYSDQGRNVERRECLFFGTNMQENIGLVSFTSVELNLLKVLEKTEGNEADVIADDLNDKIDMQDQEMIISSVQSLLVKIQKNKAVSLEGSKAFLHLVSVAKSITKENAESVINKFKSKKVFKHLVDAAAGSNNIFLHKSLYKVLAKQKSKALLERYLISLSFVNPDEEILSELARDVENIPEKDKNIKETAIYTLCHLAGKLANPGELVKDVFKLVRDSGPDCKSGECQKKMVNCVSALASDGYTKQLVQQAKTSQDKQAKEMAITALGKPGLVAGKMANKVDEELLEIFMNEDQSCVERLAAFNSVKLGNDASKKVLENIGRKDKDISSFVSQKLYHKALSEPTEGIKQKIFNYDFLSLQNSAQSVFVSKTVADIDTAKVGFGFSLIMKGNALKRTSFVLKAEEPEMENEILRLDSTVGGLSSYVGEADPQDDPDPNASVQLSILGLPLRPFVLFSSFGDLFDMYMSGAGEKLTSFISGSVLLLDKSESFPLSNGLELSVQATAVISFDFAGKADISIWSRTGKTHVENAGVIVVNLRANIGKKFLLFESSFAAEGVLEVDTDVDMGGEEVMACVRMKQKDTKMEMTELQSLLGKEKVSATESLLPGLTWNLNMKNNDMCNRLLK